MLSRSPFVDQTSTLDLRFNGITATGAQSLAASPRLAHLTRLALTGNRIGDTGARALLNSPHLGALRRLDVRDCYIVSTEDALRQRFGSRVKI